MRLCLGSIIRVTSSRLSTAGSKLKSGRVMSETEVNAARKVAVLNQLPKLRVYDLRHTHASLLIHEGVHPKRISERLGHSSIKLTMDTYGHLFEGSDRDSAAKMEKLLAPKHKRSGVQIRVLPKTAS